MNDRLGKILKDLRIHKGIGLAQLAKSLRIDRAHLSRIETGKILPADPLLRRLCKRLGGDIEVLTILAGRLPKDIEALFSDNQKKSFPIFVKLFG